MADRCRSQRARAGFGLLELMVVIVVLGVLATAAVPRATYQAERLRLDRAVQDLRSIWKAERRHRLMTGVWTDDLDQLVSEGLLRLRPEGDAAHWTCEVAVARGDRLVIRARRKPEGSWRGEIVLDETGEVSGFVTDGGTTLTP